MKMKIFDTVARLMLFASALILMPFDSFSQDTLKVPQTIEERYDAYLKYLSPEKVYLHTDKDVYSVGDTVWFKAYIANGSFISEYPESRFIYVELVGSMVGKDIKGKFQEMEYLQQRVKVKLRGNVMEGYLAIPDDANTGYNMLRAYTYWNLNRSEDYLFKKEITVINPVKDSYIDELKSKKVRDDSHYETIGVENPFHQIKTVNKLDCAFLPESGRLLSGIPNRIGVKVIGSDGLGVQTEGVVYGENKAEVAVFATDEYGLGSFMLTPASGGKYSASFKAADGTSGRSDLPDVEDDGASISLRYGPDMIEALISLRGKVTSSGLRFILTGPDEVYYNVPLENVSKIKLPLNGMPKGVNNAVICTQEGRILAKRPFFVMPEASPAGSIILDRPAFSRRDNVGVVIDAAGASGGSFSVSVTDNLLAPSNTQEDNLVSYMFLSSEIRGNVENPRRFFCDTIPLEKRIADADLMLMTQGWEYYDLPEVFSGRFAMPKFGREYVQSISGFIKKGIFGKSKASDLAFLAPSINFVALGRIGPEGFFELTDLDFPDSTTFIVSGQRADSKKKVKPFIYEDSFAPMVKMIHNKTKVAYTPEVGEVLLKNYLSTGGEQSYVLNSITVYGKRRKISGISPFPNWEFRPEEIRDGLRLENYKNYDMFSYLLATVPGLRESTTGGVARDRGPSSIREVLSGGGGTDYRTQEYNRMLYCKVAGGKWSPIMVYINALQLMPDSWWELEGMMVSDVETVVVTEGLAPGGVAGESSSLKCVFIKTKVRPNVPWHIAYGTPLGYQTPRRFYSPRYEVTGKGISRAGSDCRSTLYWNPALSADSDGKIRFRFNASDMLSGYTVTLEGISGDGKFISRQFKVENASK